MAIVDYTRLHWFIGRESERPDKPEALGEAWLSYNTGNRYYAALVDGVGLDWVAITSTSDAAEVTYTPADLDDWTGSTDPGETAAALDQLAGRTTALESVDTEETGVIKLFAGPEAKLPDGYLLCDGAEISRTTYSALFDVIEDTYGAGDGSTTFLLPDLQCRFPVGAGSASGLTTYPLGDTGGEEEHTLTVDEMPAHQHAFDQTDGAGARSRPGAGTNTIVGAYTDSTGGDDPHENRPPYLALNYIIKT